MTIHTRTDEQTIEGWWDRRARLIDHYESLLADGTPEAEAKAAPLVAAIGETEDSLTAAGASVERYAPR